MFEIRKKMKELRKSPNGDKLSVRDGSVIDIDDILRGVHLIPKFGKGPIPQRKLETVYQTVNNYYINNYIDKHMYNIMYDPKSVTPYSI